MTLQMDTGQHGKIRLVKGSAPGVGCSGERDQSVTLCIPGHYFKCSGLNLFYFVVVNKKVLFVLGFVGEAPTEPFGE